MRYCIIVLLFLTRCLAGVPGVSTPIPELRLADGTTLRDVQFVGFGSSTVMAKWQGGRGTIAYSNLPDAIYSSISAFKPETPAPIVTKAVAHDGPPKPPPKQLPTSTIVSGQVYVITRGAGAYKLPGVPVAFYKCDDFQSLAQAEKQKYASKSPASFTHSYSVAMALAAWSETFADFGIVAQITTTTDADGKYERSLELGVDDIGFHAFSTLIVCGLMGEAHQPFGNKRHVSTLPLFWG